MHGNNNTRFLSDRQRAEHAVPAMVLYIMLWNNTKDTPKDENTHLVEAVRLYADELLNSATLQRRARRMFESVTEWMVKSRFTTRKSIFVLIQFLFLLWEHEAIKLDKSSLYFKALCVLGELYDDNLERLVGEAYPKFERSGLKAVYDLAQMMQAEGYFKQLNFTRPA